MNLMKKFGALGLSAILVTALVSCGEQKKPATTTKAPAAAVTTTKATEKKTEENKAPAQEKKDLSEWKGEWNSIEVYFDKPEAQEAFGELAKKEKMTAEEARKGYEAKRKSDFKGLRIEGNKVEFLNGGPKMGGTVDTSAEYEFVKSAKVQHGGHELTWFGFKAKDANAKYPVLLMLNVHGEEALVHFHMRYGKDIDELLNMKEKWYPTFCHTDATLDAVKDEIAE